MPKTTKAILILILPTRHVIGCHYVLVFHAHSSMLPPRPSIAERAPLVTLKPLSFIALVTSPDRIILTSLMVLVIKPDSRKH